MRRVKKLMFIGFFFCTLTIPTSAFATGTAVTNQNGLQSFLDQFFSFFQGAKTTGYVGNTDSFYIDGKKFSRKEWEEYCKKKNPPSGPVESIDIWKVVQLWR